MSTEKSIDTICVVVKKFGNLDFLEPSGPLQACNGTSLRFYAVLNLKKNKRAGVDM
jgi:hypothetical protein